MCLTNKRKLSFVFLVLVIASIVATALSQFISAVLPKGVVQDFFLMSKPIGWDPFTLNLHFIQFTTGLVFEISVLSVIAMAFSWYFLRYFR